MQTEQQVQVVLFRRKKLSKVLPGSKIIIPEKPEKTK